MATIATVYWKSDERNLEGEKDKTGRPPRFGDSVRADRVQGTIHFIIIFHFLFRKIASHILQLKTVQQALPKTV